MNTIFAYFKWRSRLKKAEKEMSTAPYVPVYGEPDLAAIHNPDPKKIQLTWVGHDTFLIQAAGVNILTDPIWSERSSPVQWAGPKRQARPGLSFEDLPKIDLVLISHTHYDHLDRPTVLRLAKKEERAPHYVVPAGTKWWFANEGIDNVTELEWWQREEFGAVAVSGVPAEHWSKRQLFRTNDAGWGGYIVESSAGNIYFAGDTGYHAEYFKQIGERFPLIDLALIPIGAYYPQSFFGRYHIDPLQAVMVHKEVGAKKSIGMHWGTIKLTVEPLDEPPKELARQLEAAHIPPEEFSVLKIGETKLF